MSQRLLPPETTIVNLRDIFQPTLQELAKPYPALQLPRWGIFNKLVGGFRMREYTILCGPTGCGKTTLLANISAQLADRRHKHLVMSIETGAKDYAKRFLSVLEGRDLNTGDAIPASDLAQIAARHIDVISNGDIEFSLHETRVDLEQLKLEIRYAVDILKCKVIFVDNLNYLLRVTRAQDMIVEMDRVTHDLIEFVKNVDCHIVMVMHPRKTEGGRVVSEFDIKGSSTSVQEAQNVFLFNKPTAEEIAQKKRSPYDRELFLAKMRRRGKYVGRTLMFKNQDTRYEEDGYR